MSSAVFPAASPPSASPSPSTSPTASPSESSNRMKFYELHGLLMFVAFGIVPVIAVFAARYLQQKHWWLPLHAGLAAVTVVLAAVGIWLVDSQITPFRFHSAHSSIGVLIVCILLPAQLLAGILAAKTWRANLLRTSWNYKVHRWLGRCLLAIVIIQVQLGLMHPDLPTPIPASISAALWIYVVAVAVFFFMMGKKPKYHLLTPKPYQKESTAVITEAETALKRITDFTNALKFGSIGRRVKANEPSLLRSESSSSSSAASAYNVPDTAESYPLKTVSSGAVVVLTNPFSTPPSSFSAAPVSTTTMTTDLLNNKIVYHEPDQITSSHSHNPLSATPPSYDILNNPDSPDSLSRMGFTSALQSKNRKKKISIAKHVAFQDPTTTGGSPGGISDTTLQPIGAALSREPSKTNRAIHRVMFMEPEETETDGKPDGEEVEGATRSVTREPSTSNRAVHRVMFMEPEGEESETDGSPREPTFVPSRAVHRIVFAEPEDVDGTLTREASFANRAVHRIMFMEPEEEEGNEGESDGVERDGVFPRQISQSNRAVHRVIFMEPEEEPEGEGGVVGGGELLSRPVSLSNRAVHRVVFMEPEEVD